MVVIFGGAYQGKVDFAKEKFHIDDSDIFYCTEDLAIDYEKKVIADLHKFVLKCAEEGFEAKAILEDHDLSEHIIIVDDISQGVVPMDKTLRIWRDMVGRTMLSLCKEADSVYRVFCGIGQQIK